LAREHLEQPRDIYGRLYLGHGDWSDLALDDVVVAAPCPSDNRGRCALAIAAWCVAVVRTAREQERVAALDAVSASRDADRQARLERAGEKSGAERTAFFVVLLGGGPLVSGAFRRASRVRRVAGMQEPSMIAQGEAVP
jgi:hypothetical protein